MRITIVPKGFLTKASSILLAIGAIGTPFSVWFFPQAFEFFQMCVGLGLAGGFWGLRRAIHS